MDGEREEFCGRRRDVMGCDGIGLIRVCVRSDYGKFLSDVTFPESSSMEYVCCCSAWHGNISFLFLTRTR